jgi:hypothetical protein
MTPQEQALVNELFDRLAKLESSLAGAADGLFVERGSAAMVVVGEVEVRLQTIC